MKRSGRGAAWLARLLGVQEVPGSNPGGPTKRFKVHSLLAPCDCRFAVQLESKTGRQRLRASMAADIDHVHSGSCHGESAECPRHLDWYDENLRIQPKTIQRE